MKNVTYIEIEKLKPFENHPLKLSRLVDTFFTRIFP